MKVLKKGKALATGRRFLCKNCGALLLVLPTDVKRYESWDYLGDSYHVYSATCPECKKAQSVPEEFCLPNFED